MTTACMGEGWAGWGWEGVPLDSVRQKVSGSIEGHVCVVGHHWCMYVCFKGRGGIWRAGCVYLCICVLLFDRFVGNGSG